MNKHTYYLSTYIRRCIHFPFDTISFQVELLNADVIEVASIAIIQILYVIELTQYLFDIYIVFLLADITPRFGAGLGADTPSEKSKFLIRIISLISVPITKKDCIKKIDIDFEEYTYLYVLVIRNSILKNLFAFFNWLESISMVWLSQTYFFEKTDWFLPLFHDLEPTPAILIPKPATCMPEQRTVNLRDSDDPTLYYYPSCTRVDRCGGCCLHDLLSCQPKTIEHLNFSVWLK